MVLILLLAASLVYFHEKIGGLQRYGYAGGFLTGLLASATILVPIPGTIIVFALGGVLKYPWLLGIMVGLGEALGELLGYGVGNGGRMLIKRNPGAFYRRLEGWMRRRGGLVIFLMAAIPNPVFDLVGIAAGVLGYPLWRFFIFCWWGKMVKATGIALAGYWGLKFVLEWLEVVKVH